MIIRDAVWERVRTKFTLEEKVQLRESINGRVICPAGSTINIDALPDDLQTKVLEVLEEDKQALKVSVRGR